MVADSSSLWLIAADGLLELDGRVVRTFDFDGDGGTVVSDPYHLVK